MVFMGLEMGNGVGAANIPVLGASPFGARWRNGVPHLHSGSLAGRPNQRPKRP